MIEDVAVAALLVAGVALMVLSCAGVLAVRGVYDRLHFGAPAGIGALAACAAVLVREGFSLIGNKAAFVGVFVFLSSPILVHVTARAARIREYDDWRLRPGDEVTVEEP